MTNLTLSDLKAGKYKAAPVVTPKKGQVSGAFGVSAEKSGADDLRRAAKATNIEKFGQGLSTLFNKGAVKQQESAQLAMVKRADQLVKTIRDKRAKGMDTKRDIENLKEINKSIKRTATDVASVGTQNLTNRDVLGSAVSVASLLPISMAGSGIVKAGSTAAKIGSKAGIFKNILKGAGLGALEGTVGGGLYEGGKAIQDDSAGIGEVLARTGAGAAAGGVVGGLFGGAFPAVGGIVRKGREIGNKFRNPGIVAEELTQSYNKAFNLTKPLKTRYNAATARGIEPGRVLSERGLVVDIEDGKFQTAKAVEALDTEIEKTAELLDQALDRSPAQVTADEMKKIASRQIKADPQLRAAGMIDEVLENANKEIDNYVKQEGKDMFTLRELGNIKRAQYRLSKRYRSNGTLGQQDAASSLGRAFKDLIESKADNVAVQDANKLLGELETTADLLGRKSASGGLDGAAVKGGRLGKYFSRLAGAVAGSSVGGPAGAVAGYAIGDAAQEAIQQSQLLGPISRKAFKNFQPKTPKVIGALEEFIKGADKAQNERLLLPEGAIPMGPRSTTSGIDRAGTQAMAEEIAKKNTPKVAEPLLLPAGMSPSVRSKSVNTKPIALGVKTQSAADEAAKKFQKKPNPVKGTPPKEEGDMFVSKPMKTEKEKESILKEGINTAKTDEKSVRDRFMNMIEKQLEGTGMEGGSDVYKNRTFVVEKVPIDDVEKAIIAAESDMDPTIVKKWEQKIKKGERPEILLTKEDDVLEISDGAHKWQAYKNLGFKEVPSITAYPKGKVQKK